VKRLTVIAVAFFSSSVAITLPLGMAYVYSQRRAHHEQEMYLAERSQSTLARAELTYGDAVAALKEVEAPHWTSCSPAHIDAMRLAAFNHHSISEIGFVDKGFLVCTSWGMVRQVIPHMPYTFIRRDGVGIHLGIKPAAAPKNVTIAVNYGSHNALVDPARLTDVMMDSDVAIAVANEDGHVMTTLHDPPERVVTYAMEHPGAGILGQYAYASFRKDGWISVAVKDRRFAAEESQHLTLLLFPFALLAGAAIMTGLVLLLRRRLSPLAELEIAVRKKEFIPHYQPILHLETGRCVGAEALVRWRRPYGALVMPNFFLPLAEQSGLIEPITDQVIERVLEDMDATLHDDSSLHITINLSMRDVETGRPLPLLVRSLEKRKLPARCIWLEATERGFIQADAARTTLERARSLGHVVAIDDFGTGYSSLSLLHSLPLDVLKIDKTFVDAIATESATSTVIDHIIDIATGLNLDIIAEGIETEEQVAYLLRRGVLYGQGYLFAKALPKDEFLTFYRDHSGGPSC
jgi:sensor c-di-GMP phosphodiesterase-like protein